MHTSIILPNIERIITFDRNMFILAPLLVEEERLVMSLATSLSSWRTQGYGELNFFFLYYPTNTVLHLK
jgi:hypothetical protein